MDWSNLLMFSIYLLTWKKKKRYYVYVYLDPRKKGKFTYGDYEFDYEPIYVGKGTRNRIVHHLKRLKTKRTLFHNKLNKIINIGYEPIYYKLINNLSETEALSFEIKLIELIGRIDIETGSLCNMTEGGEKGFNRTLESRKKLSESKKGPKNPMYGKKTTKKQKESVKLAHKEGRIKLSESGRNKIIVSNKKRKGCVKYKKRNDSILYVLTSPKNVKFKISGAVNLQKFCKENVIQYHVLKNNIGKKITSNDVVGKRIFAKNTIGWYITIK